MLNSANQTTNTSTTSTELQDSTNRTEPQTTKRGHTGPAPPKPCRCDICGDEFGSKTKLFKHLVTHGYDNGGKIKDQKLVLLIGWIASSESDVDHWVAETVAEITNDFDIIHREVEQPLLSAIYAVEHNLESIDQAQQANDKRFKGFSRGTGFGSRSSYLLSTEASCHGACDTFCVNIAKHIKDGDEDTWMQNLNKLLPTTVRVFKVYILPEAQAGDFHAETSCTQRRYEYMVPLKHLLRPDFIADDVQIKRKKHYRGSTAVNLDAVENSLAVNMDIFHSSSGCFKDAVNATQEAVINSTADTTTNISDNNLDTHPFDSPEGHARVFFFRKLKKVLKLFGSQKLTFHNYVTGGAVREDAWCYSKVDRIYHKELLCIDNEYFVVFSISAETVLRGQIRKLLGIAVAIARGLLPLEYFEESVDLHAQLASYSVLDVPALPGYGLWIAECKYTYYEASIDSAIAVLAKQYRAELANSATASSDDINNNTAIIEPMTTTNTTAMTTFDVETLDLTKFVSTIMLNARKLDPRRMTSVKFDPNFFATGKASAASANFSGKEVVATNHDSSTSAGLCDNANTTMITTTSPAIDITTDTITTEPFLALDLWRVYLQKHIAAIYCRVGDSWVAEFESQCQVLLQKRENLQHYQQHTPDSLLSDFRLTFHCEPSIASVPVATANVDDRMKDDTTNNENSTAANHTANIPAANTRTRNLPTKKTTYSDSMRALKSRKKPRNAHDKATVGTSDVEDAAGGIGSVAGKSLADETNVKSASTNQASPTTNNTPLQPTTTELDKSDNTTIADLASHPYVQRIHQTKLTDLLGNTKHEAFDIVLQLLRLADTSNLWPKNSVGRQKVVSKSTIAENGGRGGTFSVGCLPKHLAQPKGNTLFPELMKACFVLERVLCPNRMPSSTIAINRHAQFLPHRDSGAGSGQSPSLIVALGDFVGGEIVVENTVHDIRYEGLEFNGWTQRHWTLPFVGERFSLVWFTPLGIEQSDLFWWSED